LFDFYFYQNSGKNHERFTKARQRKKQFRRSSKAKKSVLEMSTTESQAAAEAQYIDDWTGDEDGLFFITQRWGG
jgi:hypothetical protein